MQVERWIVAALRQRRFFSADELNEAIGGLLDRLNQRPFRKREGTRASLYAELDRPALQPLPVERYVMAEWKKVTGEHRLSRRDRPSLLQRSLSTHWAGTGSALYGHHGGDLPSGEARGDPCP